MYYSIEELEKAAKEEIVGNRPGIDAKNQYYQFIGILHTLIQKLPNRIIDANLLDTLNRTRLSRNEIYNRVTSITGVAYEDMKSGSKLGSVVSARFVAVWYCSKHDLGEQKHIADDFNREKSFVGYATRAIEDLIDSGDPQTLETIEKLKASLSNS